MQLATKGFYSDTVSIATHTLLAIAICIGGVNFQKT